MALLTAPCPECKSTCNVVRKIHKRIGFLLFHLQCKDCGFDFEAMSPPISVGFGGENYD